MLHVILKHFKPLLLACVSLSLSSCYLFTSFADLICLNSDEDILDLPLISGPTTRDVNIGGLGGKSTVGKDEEEKKMVDVAGGEQQQITPQQQSGGLIQKTFKPEQIMRARVNIEDQPDKVS